MRQTRPSWLDEFRTRRETSLQSPDPLLAAVIGPERERLVRDVAVRGCV